MTYYHLVFKIYELILSVINLELSFFYLLKSKFCVHCGG